VIDSRPPAVLPANRPIGAVARLGAAVPSTLTSSRFAIAPRVTQVWLPRLAWSVSRTGRVGVTGLALLIAAGVFFVSTHLPVLQEITQLQNALQHEVHSVIKRPHLTPAEAPHLLRSLPARTDVPGVLAALLTKADAAHLTIDTGKYEVSSTKNGNVVRYQMAFPVTGPYVQIREFIDSTLQTMPEVGVSDLAFVRKSVADGAIEAQVRFTIYARSAP